MFRRSLTEIVVATRGRGFHEGTTQVAWSVGDSGVTTGLCTLFLRHTSASLLIQENADPDVRADLEDFFTRLVPDGDPRFIHTAEGDDAMAAHIRTSLTSVNLSIPVGDGAPALGTWQGIHVWEHWIRPHRGAYRRHVIRW